MAKGVERASRTLWMLAALAILGGLAAAYGVGRAAVPEVLADANADAFDWGAAAAVGGPAVAAGLLLLGLAAVAEAVEDRRL